MENICPSVSLCGDWLSPPGLVDPYMASPSLWTQGATPMTAVDFLSTQSSREFPFCGVHPCSGPQVETVPRAQVWEIWLRPDVLIYSSAPARWSIS